MLTNNLSRRSQLFANSSEELQIRQAVEAVEQMGADVRLTDAIVLLQAARESVADFLDGVDQRRYVRNDVPVYLSDYILPPRPRNVRRSTYWLGVLWNALSPEVRTALHERHGIGWEPLTKAMRDDAERTR
jgi:hypothetical protein